MKSHLPSLYQTQKTNEVSHPVFTDLSHKMDLINKARITVTTIELNEIIKELYEIYQNDEKTSSTLDQTLQIKRNQLQNDKERFNNLQTKYNTLKSNSSFLKILEKKNLKYQIEELIQSINDIDFQRKSLHPPPMSADPQTIIDKKEIDMLKFLHLKELSYREYEALIYLLNKKALSVDKSEECIEPIIKEFKSISNLIECHKALENENKQLRDFEKVHIQDPMTKRQLFARLSPYGNQSMVIILQSAIQNLYQFSKNLHRPLPMNSFQNFESICTDQEFTQTELNFKAESPDHTIVPLDEAMTLIQEQYDKMNSSDVLHCCLIPKNFFEVPSSRLDNLIKSNSDLLNDMRNIHLRYEKAINDISDTTKQIMNELSQKRKYECLISYAGFNFIDLNNDHIELMKKQYSNREKLRTLEKLISSFGISLISEPNQILKEKILSYLNSNDSPSEKKPQKQSTSKLDSYSDKNLNLLCNQPPSILVPSLELALQIADINRPEQKDTKLSFLRDSLKNLRDEISASINEMDDFLKNKINILKSANEINLRKPMENEEIEANLTMRTDQYTQTEEIPNKKK